MEGEVCTRTRTRLEKLAASLLAWVAEALMNELPENCGLNRLIRHRTKDAKEIENKHGERDEFVIQQHLSSYPAGGIFEGDNPIVEKRRQDNERKK